MTRRQLERPPWCHECDPDTRLVDRGDDGAARCPRCHAATQPGGRHAPATPAAPRFSPLDAMVRD